MSNRAIPERLFLIIAGKETAHEGVVAWVRKSEYGLTFTRTLRLESLRNSELDFLRRLKRERLRE